VQSGRPNKRKKKGCVTARIMNVGTSIANASQRDGNAASYVVAATAPAIPMESW
jgi:hypothetical protein